MIGHAWNVKTLHNHRFTPYISALPLKPSRKAKKETEF